MEILLDHYEDPYQTTSVMESKRFFFVAQMGNFSCQLLGTSIKILTRTLPAEA